MGVRGHLLNSEWRTIQQGQETQITIHVTPISQFLFIDLLHAVSV
jgi:hypothetical protein